MNYAATFFGFLAGLARFMILLGVLVFVHELGHFLAAKLCKVYVVRLSLGFGKRLFGFRRGETDYCISAIPFGGYVKMVGQEDMPRTQEEVEQAEPELVEVPPEKRFDTQPTWAKLTISFAGPLMNLLFALPILWLVFMVGIQVPLFIQSTRIGGIVGGSPAENAGIEPGQRILSIDGEPIKRWDELQIKIWTSEGRELKMELEDLSGERTFATAVPTRQEDSTRATLGIEPLTAVAVSRVVPDMPAERSGLKTGDIILTYNYKPPGNESMSKLVEIVNASAGHPLVLTLLRDEQVLDITVVPEKVSMINGVEFDDNIIAYVDTEKGGPAVSSLQAGDVVTAVGGEPLGEGGIEDLLATRLYGYETDSAELTVERSRGLFRKPQSFNVSVPLGQKGMMGVVFSPMITEKFGPAQAFVKGIDAFGYSLSLTMKMFYYLFSRKVSTREMAGPIGIAFLTEESLKLGIGYYLNLVALITINLALVNLLPIPILDGGMILITLVEMVRRKPLDEKYLIFLQRVGLAFILFLVFMVTYYDIVRAVKFLLGGPFIE